MRKLALTALLSLFMGCASTPKTPALPAVPEYCAETGNFAKFALEEIKAVIKAQNPNSNAEYSIEFCNITVNENFAYSIVVYTSRMDGIVLKELGTIVYLNKVDGKWLVTDTTMLWANDYSAGEDSSNEPGLDL